MDHFDNKKNSQFQDEDLLDADEAAARMHISVSLLYKLCRHKEIPHMKIGKKYILKKEDVDLFISKHYQVPKYW